MIWKVEVKGDDLFKESYVKALLSNFNFKSSMKLEEDVLTINFLDHPYKGLILKVKLKEVDGEKITKGVIHFFNPVFSVLFILTIGIFSYAIISEPANKTLYVLPFLLILGILNYFKYRSITRKLFKILKLNQ